MAKRKSSTSKPAPESQTTAIAKRPKTSGEVFQVLAWIIEGNREFDVMEAAIGKWPTKDPLPLIAEALNIIARSGELDPELIRGWCFEAYRELYRKMVANNAFADAAAIVAKIQKMVGAG